MNLSIIASEVNGQRLLTVSILRDGILLYLNYDRRDRFRWVPDPVSMLYTDCLEQDVFAYLRVNPPMIGWNQC